MVLLLLHSSPKIVDTFLAVATAIFLTRHQLQIEQWYFTAEYQQSWQHLSAILYQAQNPNQIVETGHFNVPKDAP